MADKVVFAISLADLVSAPAKRMQKELSATAKSMLESARDVTTLDRSIKSLEAAMVKSAAVGNAVAYQKQARDLEMLKAAYEDADHGAADLASELKEQAAAAGESASRSAELAEKLVAVWEIGVEVAKTIAEGAERLGDFVLESVASKQAALAMTDALAGSAEAGGKLFDMVEGLATTLPQSKDQIFAWSKQYEAMGVLNSDSLRADIQATASAAAIMGDTGSQAFETLERRITEAMATTGKIKIADKQLASLAETGVNVSDVAAQMGVSAKKLQSELKAGSVSASAFGDALDRALIAKGQKPLEALAGTTKSLGDKFKDAIGDIFEDVDVTPFVGAMKDLLGTFSQGSASGQVLKASLGGMFNQIFKWAGQAVLITKHLFLGMIILGLKAYIAVKPWIPLLKMLGEVALVAGAAWLLTFTPAVIAAVGALGLLVAEAAIAAAPFIAIGLAVVGVYEAFKNWGAIKAVIAKTAADVEAWAAGVAKRFDNFAADLFSSAVEAGSNMVAGLLAGLARKAGELASSVAGLGRKAIGAFKGALGIASPSREFMKLGDFAAKGFTVGVTAANDNVREATHGLARAATDGAERGLAGAASSQAPAPAATPAAKSGGGVTIHVEKGAIEIHGAQGGATELTEHAVSLIFEKIALAQGAA